MPELVENKDPPIMDKIKKTNVKFSGLSFKERPILETLLAKDKNIEVKLLLKLKKIKKITNKHKK